MNSTDDPDTYEGPIYRRGDRLVLRRHVQKTELITDYLPTGIHDKASTRPTKGRIPERTSVNEKDC